MARKSTFSKEYKHLTALLVEARERSGLTQAEVAQELGRPQNYVSRLERGETRIDVIQFLWLADIIGFDAVAMLKKVRENMT